MHSHNEFGLCSALLFSLNTGWFFVGFLFLWVQERENNKTNTGSFCNSVRVILFDSNYVPLLKPLTVEQKTAKNNKRRVRSGSTARTVLNFICLLNSLLSTTLHRHLGGHD